MRKRTQSREFALQILYQMDLNSASNAEEACGDFFRLRSRSQKRDPRVRQYAERLVQGTLEHLQAVDKTIERFAENWEMKRMAYVDRNILRLSTFEMLYGEDIPVKVAINEAVELAKRYGEADSSKFVNGILDRIAKTQGPGV